MSKTVAKDAAKAELESERRPLAGEVDRPVGVVAIVGRPNVGKSALFNRLTQTQQSIVEAEPGVTRDRVYEECEWNGRMFTLVDTGGMVPDDPDGMTTAVLQQARRAMEEADLLLFVVDVATGVMPTDDDVARIIRASQRPVMLVVNKVDTVRREAEMGEFYPLGLGQPYGVSALHGLGTGELLDEVVLQLERLRPLPEAERPADDVDPDKEVDPEFDGIRIAILGRPNVGKSSLTNLIVGDQRSIVDHVPGTTRDSLDTPLKVDDQRFIIIDTAGLRRPAKVDDGVEFYSNIRALRALRRADIILMVLDGEAGITAQDRRVAGEIHAEKKGCIVIVNKWDLVVGSPPRHNSTKEKEYREKIKTEFDFLAWAPVLFVSTLDGWGTKTLFPTIKDAWEQYTRRIDTPLLNRFIQDILAQRPPPTYKGRQLKVSYAFQAKVRPPTIVLRVNSEKLLHFSYARYIENRFREAFGLVATPIEVQLRGK